MIPIMVNSKLDIRWLEGNEAISRGLGLLLKGRIDALYHQNPINIYNATNPIADTVGCSYFYVYYKGQYLAVSPNLTAQEYTKLDAEYLNALKNKSYEF